MDTIEWLINYGALYGDRLNSGTVFLSRKNTKTDKEFKQKIDLCKAGTADIMIVCRGKIIYVECKRSEGGRLSPDQVIFRDHVVAHGCYYWVCNDEIVMRHRLMKLFPHINEIYGGVI